MVTNSHKSNSAFVTAEWVTQKIISSISFSEFDSSSQHIILLVGPPVIKSNSCLAWLKNESLVVEII
jgi:hypothetical protein